MARAGTPLYCRPRTSWTAAALALLAIVLGVLAALAPVEVDDPVVSWPQAGQEPISTIVPLSPYRPLELTAEVPCSTLAQVGTSSGEALRTLPADTAAGRDQGLVVSSTDGTVRIVASGAQVLEEPLPAGSCSYQVHADGSGLQVSRDGQQLVARGDLLVPQVGELVTAATGPAATGLSVQLHTDARYQSTPSTLKVVLLVAHVLSLLALLVVAWRAWRGHDRARVVRPRLRVPDALVVLVSGAWAFLGPVNVDDSWYLLMARNSAATGSLGNYINMFNSAENPFVLSQYLMQVWGGLGSWGLLWMRLLPVLYGVVAYALLRVLLATLLRHYLHGHDARLAPRAAWALAFAHLLWWLPYGITLRPEPLIVLGSALVLLLSELARARRSVGMLGLGTAAAAVTMTASPTALAAAVPLLINLPWLWHWLRGADWANRVAAVGLAAGAATALVPIGLGDATLANALEGTAVRSYYYFSYPWYEEFEHYVSLMSSTWAVRLPMLLILAVVLTCVVTVGARRAAGPLRRLMLSYATITVLCLLALTPSPSKWVNHFGAMAAPAVVLLALALLRTPVPARSRTAAGVIAAGLAVTAAAAGFAGPSSWRPFSDWGQPFGNHLAFGSLQLWSTSPHLGPIAPRNPIFWVVVALLGLAWAWWRRGRRPSPALTADRSVLTTAVALAVVLVLAVFSFAPLRQSPGPSVASTNLASVTGDRCGFAEHVLVTKDGQERTAAELFEGAPVYADQVMAVLWPCVNQVTAANGMVQLPQYRVRAGEQLEGGTEANTYIETNGGVFAPGSRSGTDTELPSRLTPEPGRPIPTWGHIEEVVYPLPVGLVDVRVERTEQWGWKQQPSLAVREYVGRDNSPSPAAAP
ncbi:arabinosyltransferase domain-containing protein [Rhodococcus sp. X156]|uniref:arabinosyltransferase domain-containing protein n=1 Tax=Rhodococcus sp. X156 TaxID=2499145 RepID=UPI000FD90AAE|nr:arabinosyltransferase domain-containing protein [Rhodococcus sp. X156]